MSPCRPTDGSRPSAATAAPGRRRAARRGPARRPSHAGRTPSQPARKISPTGLPRRRSRGRRRRQEREPLGERAPRWRRRTGPLRLRRAISLHGSEWSYGDPVEQAVGRVEPEGRLVGRSLPGDELGREVGHEDRGRPVLVDAPLRGRRPRPARRGAQPDWSEPVPASHASRISSSAVAAAIQSSAGGAALEDEPLARPARWTLNVEPDQPSVGNGRSGTPARPCSASRSSSGRSRQLGHAVGRGGSARGRHVERAVRPVVHVLHVRVGAVAGQDDDERLGRRGVLLDVDLAGRDVDEVAGRGVEAVLEPGRAPRVARRGRTRCRSRSRSRRGDGSRVLSPGRGRHDRRVQPTRPTRGAEIAIERSMPRAGRRSSSGRRG